MSGLFYNRPCGVLPVGEALACTWSLVDTVFSFRRASSLHPGPWLRNARVWLSVCLFRRLFEAGMANFQFSRSRHPILEGQRGLF